MKLKIERTGDYFVVYKKVWFRWVPVECGARNPLPSITHITYEEAESAACRLLHEERDRREPKEKCTYLELSRDGAITKWR